MILGFTGTERGMTRHQAASFLDLMRSWQPERFGHGDCVGADAQAHWLVRACPGLRCFITVHPPINPKARAWCWGDEVRRPFAYLTRNRHIVEECDEIIATPGEYKEVLRSGTWSTVRAAHRAGKKVYLLRPDGLMTIYFPGGAF